MALGLRFGAGAAISGAGAVAPVVPALATGLATTDFFKPDLVIFKASWFAGFFYRKAGYKCRIEF